MLKKTFKIKDTIDIYITEYSQDEPLKITFHMMTTRDRLEILASREVAEFLSYLDGVNTMESIINNMSGDFELSQLKDLLDFLESQHLIKDINCNNFHNERYDRQINFFDDFILDRNGTDSQELLENKHVIFFGCGAVNSSIAEILVRAGIKKITLIDYKKLESNAKIRHSFFKMEFVDLYKTEALKKYLLQINSTIDIKTINLKLNFDTDLSKVIDNCDIVINGCDEPYIGHTSLKLGRYLQKINTPLFVSGGFDAHLMSSGELIYPPLTPCIDCIQQTFTKALFSWKPKYSSTDSKNLIEENKNLSNLKIGGPGGLSMMSNFSANISCLILIRFLLSDSSFDYSHSRHEYLINDGFFTEFKLNKQRECHVCNR